MEQQRGRGEGRADGRSAAARGGRLAVLAALAWAATAAAQEAERFAEVERPTGILVTSARDVVVASGAQGGAALVRFSEDGTRREEVELGPELGAGDVRLVWVDRGELAAVALLTERGSLVVLAEGGEPVEFDLPEIAPTLRAPDLEAEGETPVDLALTGAHFDDVAAAPAATAAAPGAAPPLDLFVTGATAGAAGPGSAGRPFLLRARIQLGATPQESRLELAALFTTQGAVSDPLHRSGVGVIWVTIPGAGGAAPELEAAVIAALPTRASATEGGADAVFAVDPGWPEDPAALAPVQLGDDTGAPLFGRVPGMTSDQDGNLYLVVTEDSCVEGAGPGVVAVSLARQTDACAPLPAPTGGAGDYVDLAVRAVGDPAHVTDRGGGQVLRVATGLPATPPAAQPATSGARGAAAKLGAALRRAGARR